MSNRNDTVILDCYTDEPSGYGVRPYLGTHQIHLSQALCSIGRDHFYLTIDDLRYCERGVYIDDENTDVSTLNRTLNCENALSIIQNAKTIYLIMGCFVDYTYFSSIPPRSKEVYSFLKDTKAKIILFYVLGTTDGILPDYQDSPLSSIVSEKAIGNTYRILLEHNKFLSDSDFLNPNYKLLEQISSYEPPIISQLRYPIIAEIETGTGCNVPHCIFCIESKRKLKVVYREPTDIINQIKCLYSAGVRHFRLGRQPNFYHYQNQDIFKMEKLLSGIRETCSDIETLHIDNANFISIITKNGIEITRLITKYCSEGNVAPLGIESFDTVVREKINKVGSIDQAMKAIEVINKFGQDKGPNGLPRFLPGINLIYGLPGQSSLTHTRNLKYLNEILEKELQTSRLFFRRMTFPQGITFSETSNRNQEYEKFFQEIIQNYVLPMQRNVYPIGSVIKKNREVIIKNGNSYLRTLGTCPIRVFVKGQKLTPYETYDIRIKENIDYRLLGGEVIN